MYISIYHLTTSKQADQVHTQWSVTSGLHPHSPIYSYRSVLISSTYCTNNNSLYTQQLISCYIPKILYVTKNVGFSTIMQFNSDFISYIPVTVYCYTVAPDFSMSLSGSSCN